MSVFACSDLHGRMDLFAQIQNFLKPDDKLFVIGDVFDRGPDGWKIYKAIKADTRITLLAGNHEHLAADGLEEWLVYNSGSCDTFSLWIDYNGGQPTFDAILKDLDIPTFFDFANPAQQQRIEKLIAELRNLPLKWDYINKDDIHIHLVHSGNWSIWGNDCLWDRKHLFETSWSGRSDEIVVHGHTPIELMIKDFKKKHYFMNEVKEYEDGAFWYCCDHDDQPHKVNLDTAARWSGQTVVLDLDTFDEHIFEGEPFNG